MFYYHDLFINKHKIHQIINGARMSKPRDNKLQEKFGEHLRKTRESQGLSLSKLASKCEIDKSNISKIERGKFNIQLTKIFELAKGLEVEPQQLLNF